MTKKYFQSRFFIGFVMILFMTFLVSNAFPQKNPAPLNEIQRLIHKGKEYYENGDSEAMVKFFEAERLFHAMDEKKPNSSNEEISEIYFYLALTYYAAEDNETNRERCREYLHLWMEKNQDKTIDEHSFPGGFMELIKELKSESQKPETKTEKKRTGEEKKPAPEKRPVIRKKPGEAQKPEKKKKILWFVIGGVVVAAGTVAAILLLSGPGTGSIQINSSPSGAKVYFDGSDTGKTTNCILSDIEQGNHTIKLVKEGYADYQKSVMVEGGETEVVTANLDANTITVTAPAAEEMWFTGEEVEIQWNTGGGMILSRAEETAKSDIQSGSRTGMLPDHSMRKMMRDLRMYSLLSRLHHVPDVPERNSGSNVFTSSKRESSSFPSKITRPSSPDRHHIFFNHRRMIHDIFHPEQVSNQNGIQISPKEYQLTQTKKNPSQNTRSDQPLAISNVKIELYRGGHLEKTIASNTTNDGYAAWTVPDDLDGASNYKVRVSCSAEEGIYGESAEFDIINLSNMIAWVDVPAGWFKMGDNFDEGWWWEKPVHNVYLSGYYISKYEVTFELYDIFCDATGCEKPDDHGWGRGQRPVINVTWFDAKDFCDWLSDKTGKDIHLPTEAQWEKAARGTDQRRYPWGNSAPNNNRANYNENVGKTMPVGSYPAGISFYGAYDMAGNVWEYCLDWYDPNYYSYSPSHNPQGPSSGSKRVTRGGSWHTTTKLIRSIDRNSCLPYNSTHLFGIRICMEK